MKTATKAVRQKKVAQVAVSREVTRKGSTMTQMTVVEWPERGGGRRT